MNSFKDFQVTVPSQSLKGDKIRIERLFNREIIIEDYRVEPSQYPSKANDKCVYLQISIGENKHVTFTGSLALLQTIEQIPKNRLPFKTTIVKEEGGRFKFT